MASSIRARVVRIGNSRGIRIPKVWIEQLQFAEEVELAVERGKLIVQPARTAREGWAKAFRESAAQGEDLPLDEPILTKWDDEEWRW